jgi:ElaB/YqjD/DUF883 family membrane-anchored ribosome-binding protein
MASLTDRVNAWLESVQANLTALEEASALKHNAGKRLAHARQALEETRSSGRTPRSATPACTASRQPNVTRSARPKTPTPSRSPPPRASSAG